MGRRAGTGAGVLFILAAVTALASCDGESDPSPSGPVAAGEFARQFADAWCSGLGPCCDSSGYAFELAQCRQSIAATVDAFVRAQAENPRLSFDEEAARACVDAQRTRFASCGDRAAFDAGDEPCEGLYRGTVALGGSCAESEECAPVTDSGVQCDAGVCAAYDDPYGDGYPPSVAAGQPCDASCNIDAFGSSCDYTTNTAATGGCYMNEGLACSYTSNVCFPLPSVGEPCVEGKCVVDSYCSARTCVPAIATGPCPSFVECLRTSYCDFDTTTCIPRKADGTACNDYEECLSYNCEGDVCRKWSAASPALCAGLLDD
jgi:hypothetical protein